jgi:glycosyltransferase involved in cell wall biosynthesis
VRALWFTEVMPRPVRRAVGLEDWPGPQAWVDSLAGALSEAPDLELAIATTARRPFRPFQKDGIEYFGIPVPEPHSRRSRIVAGWRHRLAPDSVLDAAVELVREQRPDIVHVHGTEGAFGPLAGRLAEPPCVVSLQGILQLCQRVYWAGRSAEEVGRLLAGNGFLKGRGVVHRYLLMRRESGREARVMREGRWFIGRTDWDRGALAAVNPAAAYFHCDEMMRPQFYETSWSGGDPAGARIYSTSSAMLFKGTECLLEAAAILRRRGVAGLRLRIAGVPPGSEVDALYRRVARRLEIDDAVEWLGRLNAPDIAGELQATDVFAYPTHIDNSPNALVEAMLVGVPTVASCVGGIPSLMSDGKEGLLVPRGDPVALAVAIERLLGDRAAAAQLGAAARETARRRNDPARVVAGTLETYREIIARSAADGSRDANATGWARRT